MTELARQGHQDFYFASRARFAHGPLEGLHLAAGVRHRAALFRKAGGGEHNVREFGCLGGKEIRDQQELEFGECGPISLKRLYGV